MGNKNNLISFNEIVKNPEKYNYVNLNIGNNDTMKAKKAEFFTCYSNNKKFKIKEIKENKSISMNEYNGNLGFSTGSFSKKMSIKSLQLKLLKWFIMYLVKGYDPFTLYREFFKIDEFREIIFEEDFIIPFTSNHFSDVIDIMTDRMNKSLFK